MIESIPIAERPAPHVCRHGFLPGECLAEGCENAVKIAKPVPVNAPKRFCAWCGEELTAKRGEKNHRFLKRRHCGRACAVAHRRHEERAA